MPNFEVMDPETTAELLGVSTRQLRRYVEGGMPCQEEGRKRTFNWPQVLEWYVGFRAERDGMGASLPGSDEGEGELEVIPNQGETIQAATLRKMKADADLKELALSRERGQVIVIADAKVRLDRMMGNLRSKILALPERMHSRIHGLRSPAEQLAAMKEEAENVCREIATGSVVEVPPEPKQPETVAEITASAEEEGEEGLDPRRLLSDYDELER